jgi:hypothetical protein
MKLYESALLGTISMEIDGELWILFPGEKEPILSDGSVVAAQNLWEELHEMTDEEWNEWLKVCNPGVEMPVDPLEPVTLDDLSSLPW